MDWRGNIVVSFLTLHVLSAKDRVQYVFYRDEKQNGVGERE